MKAKEFVDSLLKGYEETAELEDFKKELQSNIEAKVESLVRDGMDEGAAFAKARSELGDVWELAGSLFRKAGEESAENRESQERPAQGFTGVSMECQGSVAIHPGHAHRVVVTADGNLQELVKTEVAGATLRISAEGVPMFKMIPWLIVRTPRIQNLQIDVYMPELRSVAVGGSGNVSVGSGSASSLGLRISGSGNVRAESYEARDVAVKVSGSGNARVRATDTLAVKLSGSGSVNAESCETRNVAVEISSSGEVQARATEKLEVKISGSGSLSSEGCDAREVKASIFGSGKVKARATESLEVKISGSGSVSAEGCEAREVKASIHGSGKVKARATESLEVKISGSGSVSAEDCETQNVDIEIAGSGEARAWASQALSARLSGSGNVYYKGGAALDLRSNGSGRVKRL